VPRWARTFSPLTRIVASAQFWKIGAVGGSGLAVSDPSADADGSTLWSPLGLMVADGALGPAQATSPTKSPMMPMRPAT
jgi:hypothetical protein